MHDHPEESTAPPPEISSSQLDAQRDIRAGRDLAGDDIVYGDQAGRDIAGGDIAGGDIVHRTTIIGMSPRLVITLVTVVGVLVFLTAACFFSGGLAMGFVALNALNRDVAVSTASAGTMQAKLSDVSSLGPDQPFELTFSEVELNSYFNLFAGPENGIENGKIRLLEPGQIVVGGSSQIAGQLPVAARLALRDSAEQSLEVTAGAVQLMDLGTSSFGWVALPKAVLQPSVDQLNQMFGSSFRVTGVQSVGDAQPESAGTQPGWVVQGVTAGP